jgi:hypothetical protein
MDIRILHGDIHLIDLRTRMPFKYGIATLTSTPHAFVRLRVEIAGKVAIGVAADSLPPKWFTKDPARPLEDEIDEMLRVIEHGLQTAIGLGGQSPFQVWRQLYQAQADWGRVEQLPPLLSNFGTALVERAFIEAVCRMANKPFAEVLRSNLLGIQLGEVHKSLTGIVPQDLLPERPLSEIVLRQTVGLADPLDDDEISPAERLQDGLPQTLEQSLVAYGLRHLKIKVKGALEEDQQRLGRVARLVKRLGSSDYVFSLDGNEQFHSRAEFQDYWEALSRTPAFREFFQHLLFIEQPFHRDVALQPDRIGNLRAGSGLPPIVIDESDGDLDSLPQALRLGYAGTSHKNCKGVFKGIANYCLLARRRRDQPEQPALMSGEDLVNIGPAALLQDLAVCASLGLATVERNGHHYFAGLSMFPAKVQRQVLEAHGDLYHATPEGWPTLSINNGVIQLDSLLKAPFGVGFQLDVEQFTPVADWWRAHGLAQKEKLPS